MKPINLDDNYNYDDDTNPLKMGDILFNDNFGSTESSCSSQSSHAQSKRGANNSWYTNDNAHTGFDEQYYYQNDDHYFDYGQDHRNTQGYANQSVFSNACASELTCDVRGYDNKHKGQPYNSTHDSRKNVYDRYFPDFDAFVDGGAEVSEMYSQPWAKVGRDGEVARNLSAPRNSWQDGSSHSVASIGATGLPSPVKPFHWVPNQKVYYNCNEAYTNQQHSFLNAALYRFIQQQQRQHENNYKGQTGAHYQSPLYDDVASQQRHEEGNAPRNHLYFAQKKSDFAKPPPRSFVDDEKGDSSVVGKPDYDNAPDDSPSADADPDSQLSFFGPIGVLGCTSAKRYYKLKNSTKGTGLKERDLRLKVWCDWDILLEAEYVDSPKGIDELDDDKGAQDEKSPQHDSTNPDNSKAPKEEKLPTRNGVSGMGPEADKDLVSRVQDKHAESSKFQGDTLLNTTDAQRRCENSPGALENRPDGYACLDSMMNLWGQDTRSTCKLQCSDICFTKNVDDSSPKDPKTAPNSHKNVGEPTKPPKPSNLGKDTNSSVEATLKECQSQQKKPKSKKKKHKFAHNVMKFINIVSFGSIFDSNGATHSLAGVGSDIANDSGHLMSLEPRAHSNAKKLGGLPTAHTGSLKGQHASTQSEMAPTLPDLCSSSKTSKASISKATSTEGLMELGLKLEGCSPTAVGRDYVCHVLGHNKATTKPETPTTTTTTATTTGLPLKQHPSTPSEGKGRTDHPVATANATAEPARSPQEPSKPVHKSEKLRSGSTKLCPEPARSSQESAKLSQGSTKLSRGPRRRQEVSGGVAVGLPALSSRHGPRSRDKEGDDRSASTLLSNCWRQTLDKNRREKLGREGTAESSSLALPKLTNPPE